jgi:hypothetical protein
MKKYLALAILLIIPVAVCSQSIGGYYGPVGGEPAGYLFYDTFTGVDGTSLPDHTPDLGGAWTGNSAINSNTAYGGTVNYTDVGTSNHTIQDIVKSGAGDTSPGIITRYADGTHLFTGNIYPGSSKITIYERLTLRASTTTTLDSGTYYTLRVVSNGTTITVYANGVSATYTDAGMNTTATKVGILHDLSANRSDNFSVLP